MNGVVCDFVLLMKITGRQALLISLGSLRTPLVDFVLARPTFQFLKGDKLHLIPGPSD